MRRRWSDGGAFGLVLLWAAFCLGLVWWSTGFGHVTSTECQTLYRACLNSADVVVTPLPIDPPVLPETPPDGKAWECYYKSLSKGQQQSLRDIARKRGWTPEEATIWHYNAPGWGGKARGAKWGCETEPVGDAISQRRFHHTNNDSGHGFGSAVVLCEGDNAASVTWGGETLRRHGNLDKNREVWATFGKKGLRGEVVVTLRDGRRFVSTADGWVDGECGS